MTPADNKSNKMSRREKGNKKRCWNNSNNKGKTEFLHVAWAYNPAHSSTQCRTLKREVEKHKKGSKHGNHKHKKRKYNPSKEEIRALAVFSKEHLAKEYKNVNK